MPKDIYKIIAKFGIELHSDRLKSIADGIASLTSVNDFYRIQSAFGPTPNKRLLNDLELAWKDNVTITPLEIASALRGASVTATVLKEQESVELVWTGPFTGTISSRHTEQALLEVIQSAKYKVFVVSFVAYDFDSIKNALLDSLSRNVQVNILVEKSKAAGGNIDIDSISALKNAIPTANIYSWNTNTNQPNELKGSVHAKCAVADGAMAFISSANLTRAAMEKNIELGILIRGGRVPFSLDEQLNHLIATKLITLVE